MKEITFEKSTHFISVIFNIAKYNCNYCDIELYYF